MTQALDVKSSQFSQKTSTYQTHFGFINIGLRSETELIEKVNFDLGHPAKHRQTFGKTRSRFLCVFFCEIKENGEKEKSLMLHTTVS